MLSLNETEPFNGNFDQLGFGSLHFLNNMGSLNIAFLFYLAALVLLVIVDQCTGMCKPASWLSMYLNELLFHSYIIDFIVQSYSIITLCCAINFYALKFDSYGEAVQSGVTIFFACLLFVVPLWVFFYLRRNWEYVGTDENVRYFGVFYSELRLEAGKQVLWWPMFFIFRRLMVTFIVTVADKIFIVQLMLFTANLLIAVFIVGLWEPFEDKAKARTEYFNEIITFIILYHMICFSPLVPDPNTRFMMGYPCAGFVALHLVISMACIIY